MHVCVYMFEYCIEVAFCTGIHLKCRITSSAQAELAITSSTAQS